MSPGCTPYYPVTLLTHYSPAITLLTHKCALSTLDLPHQRVLTIGQGSGVGCLYDVGELAILEMKTDPPRWFPTFN